jgi:multiple sugar transport system substrate-binding protein
VTVARGPCAVAACVLAGLAGCSAPGSEAIELRMWVLGREGELVAELVAGFEREHPGIHVELQQLPFLSAHEKLLTAFVGDATPDLAPIGNTWLSEFAALGALAPLDAEIAASSVVRPADYFAGIWDTNQVDGVPYGVPWYVDTRLVFYRRDRFTEAGYPALPDTWAGWLAAMRAIKARVGPERFAVLLPLDEWEQLSALALQSGEPLLRDRGRWGNFRSAGARRALGFYLQLFVDELAPKVTLIQVPNPWDELARGYFACFIHGPWSIGEFKRRLAPDQQALWATAPLPGPRGPGASLAGGSSFVVFRRSRHARQAWQLIEYLSRPDIQRRFYALSGDLPPRRSSWDGPELAAEPRVAAFRDQLERVHGAPAVPEWERIATEIRIASERAARRVSPATTPGELAAIVDDTAAEIDERIDQLLDKRRWILAREAR